MFNKKVFKTEKELAKAMVEYLSNNEYEVWQEVRFGHRGNAIHDIVTVKNNQIHIIECKLTLGLPVIEQAYNGLRNCHYMHVCTPRPKKDLFKRTVCNQFGIGVFYIDAYEKQQGNKTVFTNEVSKVVTPTVQLKLPTRLAKNLEYLKTVPKSFCEAGGKDGGYYTPYKATIQKVKEIITQFPGITLSSLISELGTAHHYASKQSARSSLRSALEKYETSWCLITVKDNKFYTYNIKG